MKSNPYFRFLASLKLAVFCLLGLAAVLAIATCLESIYGTRAVYLMVYGTAWFFGLLFLLGMNVLCAALIRYPWKKTQTGFVITHLGILVILFGSLLTQRFGVDGNLPVSEGDKDSSVILTDSQVILEDDDGKKIAVAKLPETALRSSGQLLTMKFPSGQDVVVDTFLPRARYERNIIESRVPGVGVPALQVEMANTRFRLSEWLTVNEPEKPTELSLGPAILSFRFLWSKKDEDEFLKPQLVDAKKAKPSSRGFILLESQGKEFRVSIDEAISRWVPISGTSLELNVEKYFSYAVVEKNVLVNKSKEPTNPAVTLKVRSKDGREEKHSLFALFPEFSTHHRREQKKEQAPMGLKLKMVTASQARESLAGVGTNRGQLMFAQSAETGKVYYRVHAANGNVNTQGEVEVGKAVATGWMDLEFTVLKHFRYGSFVEEPRYVERIEGADSNFLSAIRVSVSGDSLRQFWLFEGSGKHFEIGGKNYRVSYNKDRLVLPFAIQLDKFNIGTDPGSTKPASYESRVRVRNMSDEIVDSALISMNEPLKHAGYTLYQASYQMQEGRAPVSVFSVNKDPGRPVKYAGSLIMILGITLMFWMNPHYWEQIFGRSHKGARS